MTTEIDRDVLERLRRGEVIRRRPPRNWSRMVAAIRESGLSLRQIARCLQVSHSTVQRWDLGSCPNAEDAQALDELYRRVVGARVTL